MLITNLNGREAPKAVVLKLQSFTCTINKSTTMQKLFILAAICFFAACGNNNNRQSTNNSDQQTANTGIPKDSVAKAATFSFVDGCMDNFRIALGEAKAYAFCKCIYNQIKAQNPTADSLQVEELARDTALVRRVAASCQPR
jgi:hypothetical protein